MKCLAAPLHKGFMIFQLQKVRAHELPLSIPEIEIGHATIELQKIHVLRIQLAENAQLRFGYVRKEYVSCYYTMKMWKSSYAGKEGQTTL